MLNFTRMLVAIVQTLNLHVLLKLKESIESHVTDLDRLFSSVSPDLILPVSDELSSSLSVPSASLSE